MKEHPFLAGLKPQYVKLLTGCAANVVFQPGEYLFREGDDADSFYFIRQGRVVIETSIPGKEPLVIQSREAGEVTGWSWLIPPYRWHFDARALELTRAISLDGKCLREKFEKDHDLGFEVMKRFTTIMADRLEATRLQLMDVYGPKDEK